MAAFNAEIVPPRSLGRWDSASMVEVAAREPCDVEAVRKVQNPNGGKRQFRHETSCANRPIW